MQAIVHFLFSKSIKKSRDAFQKLFRYKAKTNRKFKNRDFVFDLYVTEVLQVQDFVKNGNKLIRLMLDHIDDEFPELLF